MYPHLHLLVPSSTPDIDLEVRLYLPPQYLHPALESRNRPKCPIPTSTTASSKPVHIGVSRWRPLADRGGDINERLDLEGSSTVDGQLKAWVRGLGRVDRLIIACHPWGTLGGSCLDPVIADYLPRAVYSDTIDGDPSTRKNTSTGTGSEESESTALATTTAILTWNVRGVGNSGGSMGWFGLSNATNVKDLQALEEWAFDLFPAIKAFERFGYSWGSLTATTCPIPSRPRPRLSSLFLVSPPIKLFKLASIPFALSSTPSFDRALRAILGEVVSPPRTDEQTPVEPSELDNEANDDSHTRVCIVCGTRDEFTSRSAYQSLAEEYHDHGYLHMKELEGGGHFYRRREEAQWLIREISRRMT